jgi:hypothetical protein
MILQSVSVLLVLACGVLSGPVTITPSAPLSREELTLRAEAPLIPHGDVAVAQGPSAVAASAVLDADVLVATEVGGPHDDPNGGLGRALGMQSRMIFDSQLTASSSHGNNVWYYGPRNARLHNLENYGGWLGNRYQPNQESSEWLQIDLDRLTTVGGIATQGCHHGGHWTRTYRIEYSENGSVWKKYSDDGADNNQRVFSGNTDYTSVVTNTFPKPFLARMVRVMIGATQYGWACMRAELYSTKSEPWAGGQPLGVTDGTVSNDAMTASSAHGNNWVYYGPQHARLYGGGPWGGWIPEVNRAGEWVQVDFGKEVQIGAVATQGRRDGSYWVTSYFLQHSRDGATWRSYSEGGLRRMFSGNVNHYDVAKLTLQEPFIARYVRLTVNEFANGWPTLRLEYFAPEHKRFRTGTPLGISTRRVPDSALTASSAHGNNWDYYGPRNARLFVAENYGSWIPNYNRAGEWLSVDLGSVKEVGGVATQGRRWGGCWWKAYDLQYSVDGTNWTYYMMGGSTARFQANMDGDSVKSHVLDSPFVARHVRITVQDWENWPCARWEVFGPHASRLNDNKKDNIGEPMGIGSGDIADDKITASSFYPSDANDCRPANARLNSKKGAGGWCSKTNDGNQWLQVELDGTIQVAGLATQGRAQDSEAFSGARQWVTLYKVETSGDGKTFKALQTEDGDAAYDQLFRGNEDPSTVVVQAFNKPLQTRFLRIRPQGWMGHVSMRFEIYDTATRQAALAREREEKKAAEAAAAAEARKVLEAKAAAEEAERRKREAEEAEAKEKAESEQKAAEFAAATSKSAEEKAAAEARAKAAKLKLADVLNAHKELEAALDAEEEKTRGELSDARSKVEVLEAQVEQEKFNAQEYREVQRKISDVEVEIADEHARKLRAQTAWALAEAENDQEIRKGQLLARRLREVQQQIEAEKKKIEEDKASEKAVVKKEEAQASGAATAGDNGKNPEVEVKKV